MNTTHRFPQALLAAAGMFMAACGSAHADSTFDSTSADGVVTINSYTGSDRDVTIPATIDGLPVTRIGDGAFMQCMDLTSVTIPASVTSIGDQAFFFCFSLTSASFLGNAPTLGNSAFDCTSFEFTVYYQSGATGFTSPPWDSYASALIGVPAVATPTCTRYSNATTATLGGNVTSSGGLAITALGVVFAPTATNPNPELGGIGVTNLTVTPMGGYWFTVDVSGLTPGTHYSFATYAINSMGTSYSVTGSFIAEFVPFTYTSTDGAVTITGYTGSDNVVVIPATIDNQPVTSIDKAFQSRSSLTSITIPTSVTNIGVEAFSGCTGLTSITIPDSVTSIGGNAFASCTGLTSITIPANVTSIAGYAFYYCTGLPSITIPASVTSIGDDAFAYCTGLTRVTLSNGITSIGIAAFAHCTGLTSIFIPSSVTNIADWAFSSCPGLTSVTLSNGVTHIGEWAFGYCAGLPRITIPASVTSIGVGAFFNFNTLISANFLGNAPTMGVSVLGNTPCGVIVYYPSTATGFTSPTWKGYTAVAMQTSPATVTLSNLTQTYNGAAKPVSVVTSPTNLEVNVTYNGNASAPANVGNYTVIVTISAESYSGGATNTLEISKAAQSITFGTLPVVVYGDAPFALTASASSGLPVSYVSADTAVATVAGSTVFIRKAGGTLLTASQVGNGNYLAATNVSQNLLVDELLNGLGIHVETNAVILTITGNPGREYAISYSDALTNTDWPVLTTIPNLPSSPYAFKDPAPVLQTNRFYRLLRSIWRAPDN